MSKKEMNPAPSRFKDNNCNQKIKSVTTKITLFSNYKKVEFYEGENKSIGFNINNEKKGE